MNEFFADLHVHIGRAENNKPIKITAARSLNFANIAKECEERKGINIVGIIDCASPYVIADIEEFLKTGDAYELEDGGIIYKDKVCIILGSETETSEIGRNGKKGSAHNLCYFPHLKDIKAYSEEMKNHIKNITLSTQRSDLSGYELIDIVEKHNGILIPAHIFTPFKSYYGNCTDNGILIPAHIFTPFKSYYGNCTDRLKDIFKEKYEKVFAVELGLSSDTYLADMISELEDKTFLTNSGNCTDRLKDIFKEKYEKVFAVELGLSSDTYLADMISELEDKTFLTNSDAHSLPKIAREYNKVQMEDISFKELVKALKNEDGRKIISNYGLDPKLGKYHRTYCDACNSTIQTKEPVEECPYEPIVMLVILQFKLKNL